MAPSIRLLDSESLDQFLVASKASSYSALRCWLEYTNVFLSMYFTTTAIRDEVMQFRHLKQVPHKTDIELSSRINEMAYECGSAFTSENKIPTFLIRLQSTIQTSVAHETEEPDDKRQ